MDAAAIVAAKDCDNTPLFASSSLVASLDSSSPLDSATVAALTTLFPVGSSECFPSEALSGAADAKKRNSAAGGISQSRAHNPRLPRGFAGFPAGTSFARGLAVSSGST